MMPRVRAAIIRWVDATRDERASVIFTPRWPSRLLFRCRHYTRDTTRDGATPCMRVRAGHIDVLCC